MSKRGPQLWNGRWVPKRVFLRLKRAHGMRLLDAMSQMQRAMAYLPPAEDCNAAGHMHALKQWITGPCRRAWRKA